MENYDFKSRMPYKKSLVNLIKIARKGVYLHFLYDPDFMEKR
jgi:hypothetical protein